MSIWIDNTLFSHSLDNQKHLFTLSNEVHSKELYSKGALMQKKFIKIRLDWIVGEKKCFFETIFQLIDSNAVSLMNCKNVFGS